MRQLILNEGQYENLFKEEKQVLSEIFGDKIKIEHVGSTAVKGALTRGVVDIIVGVSAIDEIVKYVNQLNDFGYVLGDKKHVANRKFFDKMKHKF